MLAIEPIELLACLAFPALVVLYCVVYFYIFHRHYLPWTKEGKRFRWACRTARLVPSVRRNPSGLPQGAQFTFVPVRPAFKVNGIEPEVTLGGLFFDRSEADGLLIVFPGEGEIADDFTALARSDLLRLAGLSLWITDFRGSGRSRKGYLGGSTYPALLDDSISIFNAIPEIEKMHGGPFAKRVLLGRSIGCVPALAIAAVCGTKVSALVLDNPVVSVRKRYESECKGGSGASDWPDDEPDVPTFSRRVLSPVLAICNEADSAGKEEVVRMVESMLNEGFRSVVSSGQSERISPIDGSGYDALFPFLNALPQDGSVPLGPGMALSSEGDTIVVNPKAMDESFVARWKGFTIPIAYDALDYSLGLSRLGATEPEPPWMGSEEGESFEWTAGATRLVGFFQWRPRVAKDAMARIRGTEEEDGPRSSLAYVAAFALYLREYSSVARLILTLETSKASEKPFFCEFNRNAANERINHGCYNGAVDRDSVRAFFIDILTNGHPEEMHPIGTLHEGWELKRREEESLSRPFVQGNTTTTTNPKAI